MHFLSTQASEPEHQALLASLDEASDIEQAHEAGMLPNSFRRLRRQARAKVQMWVEEVSYVAADEPRSSWSDAPRGSDAPWPWASAPGPACSRTRVHRGAISCRANVVRRVRALIRTHGTAHWWQPWQRDMIANVLVIRCPTGKEVS
jgi:hypothetical protein